MTRIEIVGDRLKIEILGWDKFWSFKSRLDLLMGNVTRVRWVDDLPKFGLGGIRAFRSPGTHLPGVIVAGSYYYYNEGTWAFWDVHDKKKVIEIGLQNERYATLMIEVEDPEATVRLLRQAMIKPNPLTSRE